MKSWKVVEDWIGNYRIMDGKTEVAKISHHPFSLENAVLISSCLEMKNALIEAEIALDDICNSLNKCGYTVAPDSVIRARLNIVRAALAKAKEIK